MGLYNVVTPCVVAKRHHVRPTTAPIEVADDLAAQLVESGCLEPYRPGGIKEVSAPELPDTIDGLAIDSAAFANAVGQAGEDCAAVAVEPAPPRRPRSRRRRGED